MYEIVIIGAGPAGISAGLYSKRSGNKVLILYNENSNLQKTEKIENYYGFANGIDGNSLFNNGLEQAINLGIECKKEEVISIEKNDKTFIIKTEKQKYEAKAVIIATGSKKLKPNIDGIEEFEGKGISYCAICDGFFYKDKKVVVIGNGKFAINEANDLKKVTSNVRILTNGLQLDQETEYEFDTRKIKKILGEEKVQKIEFDDGNTIDVDGIFIAVGIAGGSDFAKKIGILVNNNDIVVDTNMRTNIEGLYACGDVTGGLLQICKSIYEGAKAGLDAGKYVSK